MMEFNNAEEYLRGQIEERAILLNRVRKAYKNADATNEFAVQLSLEEMLELLNITAGDEELYPATFEISICGFKCSVGYFAETHEIITDAIKELIEDKEQ